MKIRCSALSIVALVALAAVGSVSGATAADRRDRSAEDVPPGSIAYIRGHSFSSVLHTVDADGTGDMAIDPAGQGGDFMHAPDWSPDGTHIAFGTAYNNDIYVLDVSGEIPEPVDDLDISGDDPKWSPTGDRFALVAQGPDLDGEGSRSQVFVVNVDGSSLTQVTFGQDTTDEPGSVGNHTAGSPTWSPGGQIVYVRSFDTVYCCTPTSLNTSFRTYELVLMDADGSDPVILASDSATTAGLPANPYGNPDFSPDGRTLVYDHDVDDDGMRDIVLRDMKDGSESVLTAGADPSFSPDGNHVAYTAGLDVWRVGVDGGDPVNVTEPTEQCRGDFFCGSPAWQPVDLEHQRKVTLEVSGGRASGAVKVPDGYVTCSKSVPVKVQRKSAKGWRKIASTMTNAKSKFNVEIGAKKGSYRAKAPEKEKGGQVCLAATSKAFSVKARS